VLLVLVVVGHRSICTAAGLGTVGGMKHETPRTPDGAKLCAWCGGEIKQSGVGRSRDYCRRLCRDRAYKQRRDQRLIDAALADARPVSPSVETGPTGAAVSPDGETGFGQVAPPIPAPAVPEEDYLLAPPVAADPVLPDAWRAPAPAPRRPLSRRRSQMQASPMPLWSEPDDQVQPDE
jgi:hypothetical protein